MDNKVIIKCIKGENAIVGEKKEWVYTEPDNIILGREKDCHIPIINEGIYKQISRYQAQLNIRPPKVYIKDYGSLNGTYVNEKCIGKREKNETPQEGQKKEYPLQELQSGDMFYLGKKALLKFQVEIFQESEENYVPPTEGQESEENYVPPTEGQELEEGNIYRIKEENAALIKTDLINKGGFGSVYIAKDINSGKKYALKELKPEIRMSDANIRFFQREASLLKQLNHPNIIKVYENYFDKEDGKFSIVMEYCSGGDLSDYLRQQGGRLDLGTAVQIILILLDALDYVHHAEIMAKDAKNQARIEHGLIHRDLKPENILFTADKNIKLTDFGLAKAFDLAGASGGTVDGVFYGSYRYMSRRQLLNYRYSKPDVDVFAMAAIFYQMLTGQYIRNFEPEDNIEPQLAVLKRNLVPIMKRNALIPVDLAKVIDGILQEENYKDDDDFKRKKMFSFRFM